VSGGKNLKRALVARRTDTKASPIPDTTEKTHWQRRFTWLVQATLADPLVEEPMSPSEAGAWAKEIVAHEFVSAFPDEEVPAWML